MKNSIYFLVLLAAFVLLIQSCRKDNSPYNSPTTTYYYLTFAQLNQTPYFTSKTFDTISFASDKGDTLTFVKTKTDTTWYCESTTNNPDNKDQNCYQTLHNSYTTIKGNGSFDVKHIMNNNFLNAYLQVKFNNYIFYYDDVAIDDVQFPRFVGNILKFEKAIYAYNNYNDSLSAVSYINKGNGLFLLKDKLNNSQYIITK